MEKDKTQCSFSTHERAFDFALSKNQGYKNSLLLRLRIITNSHNSWALFSTINQLVQPAPATISATSTEDCELYSSFFVSKINRIFDKFQSGFRQNHSTETALLQVMNDILVQADKWEHSILVLLDVSAAFDTPSSTPLID